ncbi:MAG: hypothetical protein HZB42_02885 [Sphingobacteriales bacterium]|nr:hypothetical protein [Sphingobacteriales bacterium]
MNRLLLSLSVFCFLSFNSCTNNEIGNVRDVNPEAIYFDYRIWGEEGNDHVTIKLQYRFGGENGTTLLLEEPSKVELDGEMIKADSSSFSGVYYEVQKPVSSFSGKHTIVFTDMNKKQYKENFFFQPLSLESELPDTIEKDKLLLKLKGIDPPENIRLLVTDTSFTGEGINRLDTVYKDGLLVIKKGEIEELAPGPVQMEIIKEYDKPVKNGTGEGGRLLIIYTLRREFYLRN